MQKDSPANHPLSKPQAGPLSTRLLLFFASSTRAIDPMCLARPTKGPETEFPTLLIFTPKNASAKYCEENHILAVPRPVFRGSQLPPFTPSGWNASLGWKRGTSGLSGAGLSSSTG